MVAGNRNAQKEAAADTTDKVIASSGGYVPRTGLVW